MKIVRIIHNITLHIDTYFGDGNPRKKPKWENHCSNKIYNLYYQDMELLQPTGKIHPTW